MDFAWVAQDDSNAIQNAIVDAKGDLIAATANDTPARLAVGANGETLVADSSTSTGLRYQATNAAGKNAALNGDCVIAQRGTAAVNLSLSFQYMVDRFWATANQTATAQQISSISLNGFKNAVRIQRTAGQTSTADLTIGQTFESSTSIPFQGKTVTLSFWARAGANFSASGSTLNARVYTGTGTDQGGYGFTWTGNALPLSQSNTLTTSWQRFSVTGTIATTATQMQIFIFYTPSGTAGAADSFDITGVQLEAGSVATGFQTATGTIQGELAACQRYYWRTGGLSAYQQLGTAYAKSATEANLIIPNPVPMRVIPTSVDSSTLGFQEYGGTIRTMSTVTLDASSSPTASFIYATIAGSTAGFVGRVLVNNSTSGFLGFSAEL
jgi:hypothetical protein